MQFQKCIKSKFLLRLLCYYSTSHIIFQILTTFGKFSPWSLQWCSVQFTISLLTSSHFNANPITSKLSKVEVFSGTLEKNYKVQIRLSESIIWEYSIGYTVFLCRVIQPLEHFILLVSQNVQTFKYIEKYFTFKTRSQITSQ